MANSSDAARAVARLSRRGFLAGSGSAAVLAAGAVRAQRVIDADVVVVGAGLAGLMAASLLEQAGAEVLVVEGAPQVGGRMHTLRDLPGSPEAGGIQVGSNYRRLHEVAASLGIGLTAGGGFDPSALYHVRGETLTAKEWPESKANLLVGAERQLPPAALGGFYGRRLPRLADVDAWHTDAGLKLDIPYDAALKAAGASDEAVRLIASNTDRGRLAGYSALNPARSAAFYASAGPGGSQRLPEAMAAALDNAPWTGQIVTAIAEGADGVDLELASGRRLSARHVVCTVPVPVLRGMKLSGPSAEAMRPLIGALSYTHASFAYLAASEPFWNSDGLPGMLWSDDPLLGRVFVLGDDPAMLKLWLTGPDADAIDRMTDADAAAAVIARFEAARPSAKGKLKLARIWSWQKQPLARGTYAQIGSGQGAMLAAATAFSGKRLHFAGEHLARRASGMEGALESGANTADTIIASL